MLLIPAPKNAVFSEEATLRWKALENLCLPADYTPSLLDAALTFAGELEAATGRRLRLGVGEAAAYGRPGLRLLLDAQAPAGDGYALTGSKSGVSLLAADEAGLFYGLQTLRQLVAQAPVEVPEFQIQDAPDYPVRGFYHDVTRGAVPTLETLCQLVDKMAYYKMNHLQLYVEHTFALARHCDIWEGGDPMTAEEVLRLQEYCEARHVELVPSISTFGHMYTALRSHRLEDLNELEVKGSQREFSFYDRMAHDTLNPSDPRSLQLVTEILEEYLPLFHTKYCNICCDETFDLGKGKNRELVKEPADVKKLYVGFLKKIMAAVEKLGKVPMFWGDIIGENRELLKELPAGAVPLEWDYGPEVTWWDTAKLAAVAPVFYVCPGTCVWNRWLGEVHTAQKNILGYAKKGHTYGATGFLNTNWGDFGNVNLPASSWYGMIYGAACSWNVTASEDLDGFEDALDTLEFGGARDFARTWREFSAHTRATWRELAFLVDPSDLVHFERDRDRWFNVKEAADAIPVLEEIGLRFEKALAQGHPVDPLAAEELRFGLDMTLLTHRIMTYVCQMREENPLALADELRLQEERLCRLWHLRNKPSEYRRAREVLLRIAQKLDTMA
ncbi:MAG: family 20 glycosylhydrolase [Oligosphaeraceae bacterium]